MKFIGSYMGSSRAWIATFFLIVMPALFTEAQLADRVYPISQLTDEMRNEIDLKDGSVEDWLEVLGEPTLTPLDFVTEPWGSEYDPSSLDFRIWLAWGGGGNHLFVAAELVDDFTSAPGDGDLTVIVGVDGDRSRGTLKIDTGLGLIYPMQQAQMYTAFPGTYNNSSNVSLWLSETPNLDWVKQPPYADGGGAMIDSEPSFGVVEFYVTPFDNLIWDDKEKSTVSTLSLGKQIGFCLLVFDVDGNKWDFESAHGLFGTEDGWERGGFYAPDFWALGVLIERGNPEEDTAINSVSWAHIKASLSE